MTDTKKPTIAELEAILDSKGTASIQILPDGSLKGTVATDTKLRKAEEVAREYYMPRTVNPCECENCSKGLKDLTALILSEREAVRKACVDKIRAEIGVDNAPAWNLKASLLAAEIERLEL